MSRRKQEEQRRRWRRLAELSSAGCSLCLAASLAVQTSAYFLNERIAEGENKSVVLLGEVRKDGHHVYIAEDTRGERYLIEAERSYIAPQRGDRYVRIVHVDGSWRINELIREEV